jgi:hypothetical protein
VASVATAVARRATPAGRGRAATAPTTTSTSAGVAPHHGEVLRLQREAGNGAVCQLLASAPKPKKPVKPHSDVDDHIDLVNGLQDLLVAATSKGAKGLYAPKLGPDLSADHRALLERVRRVLIKAQANTSQRREATAEWPKLTAKLLASIAQARKLGLPGKKLDVTIGNLEAVTEHYVNTRANRPDQEINGNSYADFADGVRLLTNVVDSAAYDRTSGVIPLDLADVNKKQRAALQAVTFGKGLNGPHRALLEQLRSTLILARTTGSAKRAVTEWKKIGTEVVTLLDKCATYTDSPVTPVRTTLVDIGQKLIYGGAYSEAHNAALDKVELKSPTLAFEIEKVKGAAQDLIVAKDIADKAFNITATAMMDTAFKKAHIDAELGGAIWDIVHNPGDIVAKVEEFNKKGVGGKLVTIADLGDKMLTLRNAVYSVSLTAVKEFAASAGKAAIAKGATEAAERWAKVGSWASGKLEVLSKVGRIAGAIAIAVSVVKMFDAIYHGDWGAALQEAGTTALGLGASAAGGLAGSAMFAGIGIMIAAQVEGISGAAAMIRYCKEANVREAAMDFINICEDAAKIEARDLIADAKVLGDPDLADQREFVLQKLQSHAEWWNRHVGRMQDLLQTDRPNALGGQPGLRTSLGWHVQVALQAPTPSTFDGLGKQIVTVFEGANRMSNYVVKNYPRAG